MTSKKSEETRDEKPQDEVVEPALTDDKGNPIAEEAITHPEEAPHLDPFSTGERYLPGDPPPGQSMFPPG